MRRLVISIAVATALAGCTGPVILGSGAAAIIVTKPSSGDTADTKDQIPAHESWCYQTMGEAQCYAHPQAGIPPGTLINVDPQNLYPVDLTAYHQALMGTPVLATGAPTSLPPSPDAEIEKKNLSDEIGADSTLMPAKTP